MREKSKSIVLLWSCGGTGVSVVPPLMGVTGGVGIAELGVESAASDDSAEFRADGSAGWKAFRGFDEKP